MADDKQIKVSLTAKAYDKYSPPTNVSQLNNDAHYVTREELTAVIDELKDWIINYLFGNPDAADGGNLNGNDVAVSPILEQGTVASEGDVTGRDTSAIETVYDGGRTTSEG